MVWGNVFGVQIFREKCASSPECMFLEGTLLLIDVPCCKMKCNIFVIGHFASRVQVPFSFMINYHIHENGKKCSTGSTDVGCLANLKQRFKET